MRGGRAVRRPVRGFGGGTRASFSPSNLTTLSWWLQASERNTLVQNQVDQLGDGSPGGLNDAIALSSTTRSSIYCYPTSSRRAINQNRPGSSSVRTVYDVARTFAQIFTVSEHHFFVAINPYAVSAISSTTGLTCDVIWSQSAATAYYGIGLQSDGAGGYRVVATMTDSGGAKHIYSAAASITLGAWSVIEWTHVGGNMELIVNGVASTPVACGDMTASASSGGQGQRLFVDVTNITGRRFQGALGELVGSASASVGERADVRSYLDTTWRDLLALPFVWNADFGPRAMLPTTTANDTLNAYSSVGLVRAEMIQATQANQPTFETIASKTCPRYNGTNFRLGSGPAMSTLISASAYHGIAVIYLYGVTGTDAANPAANDLVIGEANWGLYLRNNAGSFLAQAFHLSGGVPVFAEAPITTGLHIVEWWFSGGVVSIKVDNGATYTAAGGNITTLTGALASGFRSGTQFLNAALPQILIHNTVISGSNLTTTRARLATNWQGSWT